MPARAVYTAQLIFLDTPETVGEIRAYATKIGRPLSELCRRALGGQGWGALRHELIDEHGAITPLERHRGVLDSLPASERQGYMQRHALTYSGSGKLAFKRAAAAASKGAE